MESKKPQNWWLDSNIKPKNSKWMQENLEQMDETMKKILKLIEDDADSSNRRVKSYHQKRPELVTLLEQYYRMYTSLEDRYSHVTVELWNNIPPDVCRRVDMYNMEQDKSSTLDSDSESELDDDDQGCLNKISELEAELCNLKEKFRSLEEEQVLNLPKSKIQTLEMSKLQDQIERYKSSLSDRDREIRGLKESISNANYKDLAEENLQLKEEIAKLLKEQSYLKDNTSKKYIYAVNH